MAERSRFRSEIVTFSKDAVVKGFFDKFIASTKLKRGTAEVDDAFLREIEKWRSDLASDLKLSHFPRTPSSKAFLTNSSHRPSSKGELLRSTTLFYGKLKNGGAISLRTLRCGIPACLSVS